MSTSPVRLPPPARARAGRAALIVLGVVVLMLLVGGGCSVSSYNGLVDEQTRVEAAWSQVENQYKRRFDLVPQLVATVQGAADFEESVLTQVTEARASVGRVQIDASGVPESGELQQFMNAQQGLGSALSRLMVVAENYPALKATQGFLSLQDQLEGTENRIAVARTDYIAAVQVYNASIRKFPRNIFAGLFNFEAAAQFEAEAGTEQAPVIDFGSDG